MTDLCTRAVAFEQNFALMETEKLQFNFVYFAAQKQF